MMQYRIAICDDEAYYREELERFILTYANERKVDLVYDLYEDGQKLGDAVRGGKVYDMVFLDVEMPGVNGLATATMLRGYMDYLIICFVTSHEGYALNAYEINAEGYIVKPVDYAKLKENIDKSRILIDYHNNKEEARKRYMEIEVGRGTETIDIKKIVYLEKRRNQCIIHLREREITCYQTLASVYQRLNQNDFLYTHQGYIVNLDCIKEVKSDCVCLGQSVDVPLSRGKAKEVKQRHHDRVFG